MTDPVIETADIADILRQHQPVTGMRVASGQTCKCGYWTGNEVPGVTRPPGFGLEWHQAVEVAAMLFPVDVQS